MMKIKKFFSTPRRAFTTSACIIAILVLVGAGTVFAVGTIAESSAIGAENARNFAFADAGIDPASASRVKTEFDYERGQFIYEVEFVSGNSEYEYWIKASDGAIVKKKSEFLTQDGSNATASAEITLDKAKEIALNDAGVAVTDVTFTKEKLDVDDGISVYDIDFITDNVEYEYEIDAVTGTVRSKSKDPFRTSEPSETSKNTMPADVTETQDTSRYIGVEKAKSIALSHAGVEDVTFTKAKLDHDDGLVVYEIEFRKDGMEYEYTIHAVDGSILEYDSEWDN